MDQSGGLQTNQEIVVTQGTARTVMAPKGFQLLLTHRDSTYRAVASR
jgi:hypothetical protein